MVFIYLVIVDFGVYIFKMFLKFLRIIIVFNGLINYVLLDLVVIKYVVIGRGLIKIVFSFVIVYMIIIIFMKLRVFMGISY